MTPENKKKSKEIKKSLSDYSQSKPQQLELFEVTELSSNEEYSNTIELYDQMPKYYFGGVRREKGREVDALPILRREFKHKHKNYRLEISPAALFKDGKTIHYYPSQREELVEDALRKLVANKRGVFLDDDIAVKFTLYELQKELKIRGHGYSFSQIKEAIEICNKTIVDIMSKDGNQVEFSTAIFPFVAKEGNNEINGKEQYVVMFHTLVSRSLKDKSYRLYNYAKVMKYKMNLSRWIHKRMSHNFLQANASSPYSIKMSTIIRDSGMKEYKKKILTLNQIEKSLSELQKHKIIDYFETERELDGRKILDSIFRLYVSDDFVSDIKKANKIANQKNLSFNSEEFNDNNIKIKNKLESISGISVTMINNIISRLKDVDDQYITLDALEAAEEYLNKKTDISAAAVVKSAIKDGWISKYKKSRLDIRRKLDDEGRFDERVVIDNNLPDINLLNYKTDLKENNRLLELRNNPINKKIFNNIYDILGKDNFDRWIKDKMELSDIVEDNNKIHEIKFLVPEKFLRDWIIREYQEDIFNYLKNIDSFRSLSKITIISKEQ
jgi:hypothetical protein